MEGLISTILGILLGGMVVLLGVVATQFGGMLGGMVYILSVFIAITLFISERQE